MASRPAPTRASVSPVLLGLLLVVVTIVAFLPALLPVLGLLDHYFLRYSFVGDHFQYLASVGPLALTGTMLWRGFEWVGGRNGFYRPAACGLLVGGLGILASEHTGIFRDDEALWRDTLAKNPACSMANNNLGVLLANKGQTDEAISHYQEALRLKPDHAEAHNNLACLLRVNNPRSKLRGISEC